ncbi:uncharacterized protein LODBEIA_P22130 [Lodderomyces beijingensis]|uniref:NADPH-dependent 1-acyldihydroxyacetone phosphate reductase n=1 Tax=Lodderomyces beijingensis TaxID=1775926 RepID=A0ABP0ZIM1_9ASCO
MAKAEPRRKFALVTGASSGIGHSLAKEFATKGYQVIACSPANVVHLHEDLVENHGAVSLACDITNAEDLLLLKKRVLEETGGYLDVLYNNAGVAYGASSIEMDEDKLDRLFQVNVLGHINVTKQLAPLVINAKGSIVFTSSIAARVPLAWTSVYSATKAAIDAYARTLHGEMAPFGVRVHSVITGGVQTAISGNLAEKELKKEIEGSVYDVDGALECLVATNRMSMNSKCTPDEYARDMVAQVTEKPNKFNLYGGFRCLLLNFMSRYFPLWLMESLVQRKFKQQVVFQNVEKFVRARDADNRKIFE